MALKKDMVFAGTRTCSGPGWHTEEEDITTKVRGCYIKIERVNGTKENCMLYVSLSAPGFSGNQSFNFTPDMTEGGENFIRQGYQYLKTLDMFAGATDILEEGQTLPPETTEIAGSN